MILRRGEFLIFFVLKILHREPSLILGRGVLFVLFWFFFLA